MTLSLSPKLPSRIWVIQKEIKDAYPKKVSHMPTRHVKKKEREKRCIPKEGVPHTHKVCQKKEKNKIKFFGDMQFLSRAIWVTSLKNLFYICNLSSHWALSNCCDPLWESLHTPMIKITYCWRSLERQFTYRKRTDRVAFPLEYSPKVYQSMEQVYYYA